MLLILVLQSRTEIRLTPSGTSFIGSSALSNREDEAMDDITRNDILAKFADAKTREADALQRLQAHGTNLQQVRAALGNPYFYSGRSADDPQSNAHFTGYKSHEPACSSFEIGRMWLDK
jgi:hypothetical protein